MTCVSGNITAGADDDDDDEVAGVLVAAEVKRGEMLLLLLLLLLDWDVAVVVVAVVAAAGVVGVREERLRAALIRTFTVDGIFRINTCMYYSTTEYSFIIIIIDVGTMMITVNKESTISYTQRLHYFLLWWRARAND